METAGQSETDQSLEAMERAKYERTWLNDSYRKTSPAFHRFFDQIRRFIAPGDRIIDFGCGSGLILEELAENHSVLGVDIAENCLSVDVPFKQACLWEPIGVEGDMGVCVDVLEHIPPEKVSDVIREIMACVPRCFFMACMLPDSRTQKGAKGYERLHLTVQGPDEWRAEADKHGTVTHFESDQRSSIFVIEQ
jgi:2-polyprenyl-3-methyl-5-hydroxy-6-metoxy-1,4-benzoquinol methylase